jgi:prepilin-type N-terminal cleavage/methylation domain-containing protein
MKHLRSGFTLIELMVTMVIIGIITGISVASYSSFLQRERINAVVTSLASWLNTISAQPDKLGYTCSISIRTGTLAAGSELASVTPADCSTESSLNLPSIGQTSTVTVAATTQTFYFTPRGAFTTSPTTSNANTSVTIRMSLAGASPLRCVRLSGALGTTSLGQNSSTGNVSTDCTVWSRI